MALIQRGTTKACFVLGVLLLAAMDSHAAEAAQPKIDYVGGQLTIEVLNANLADVLQKVSALVGVTIDVPDGANREVMPIVRLGPGPAREVLASLLSGARFDYVIQASERDPTKLQSVLIMARSKAGNDTDSDDVPPSRNPYARVAPPPPEVEEPAATSSPTSLTQNTGTDQSGSNPQNPSTAEPDTSGGSPLPARVQTTPVPSSPLNPPAALEPQSINQQLQQMYQQRQQMIQQSHPIAPPPAQTQ